MGEVINFHEPKKGESAFLKCPCTEEGENFLIVTIFDQDAPIITALLCPECEQEIPVVHGIVGYAD